MKIGIVGTGMIVGELLPHLVEIAGIEVISLCGTPRSKNKVLELCKKYHIKNSFINYEEFLKADIDIIYLGIPNILHYEFCVKALEAGKHVIVEKPIASNYEEAMKMAELAKNKKLFLYEAISTQYLENYRKIKELLPRIGQIKLIQCNFSQYSSRYDAFCEGTITPAFDINKAGGVLMDLNSYNIQYVVGLFGIPDKVTYNANIERGVDTSGVIVMQYNDFQAVCIAAKDCGAPARYAIQGTDGYILQDTPANICGPVTLHLNNGKQELYDENGDKFRLVAEFETFAEQIKKNDLSSCYKMLDISLQVSKVLTEARVSAGIHFSSDEQY